MSQLHGIKKLKSAAQQEAQAGGREWRMLAEEQWPGLAVECGALIVTAVVL